RHCSAPAPARHPQPAARETRAAPGPERRAPSRSRRRPPIGSFPPCNLQSPLTRSAIDLSLCRGVCVTVFAQPNDQIRQPAGPAEDQIRTHREAFMGRAGLVLSLILTTAAVAHAQSANTGALFGRVTDASSGQPVAGVTIVAEGPQGEQAELTDDEGQFTITGLPPAPYPAPSHSTNPNFDPTPP